MSYSSEPVHAVKLYDVGNAEKVKGTVEIAIEGYREEEDPRISTINTAYDHDNL